MNISSTPEFKQKMAAYPVPVKKKLARLRKLIQQTAKETGSILELEETLKWGEPSFLVKGGSTIRMDWKPKKYPDQYALYFKCTSKLVVTFREVYGELFAYEKTRALLFDLEEEIPEEEIKNCVRAALLYHTVKNEDDLGLRG